MTKTISGKSISKIGIGSYGVGGLGHRYMNITEREDDQKYIDALVYTLDIGVNFTEIALGVKLPLSATPCLAQIC